MIRHRLPVRIATLALAALAVGGCVGPEGAAYDQAVVEFRTRTGYAERPGEAIVAVRDAAFQDGELTAEEATRLALVSNARVRMALARVGVAEGELVSATIPANPTLDGEVRFVEGGGGEIIEFAIAQNVLDLLFLPRRRQVRGARLDAARAEATGALIDVAAAARTAYRDLQADLEIAALQRTALEVTSASYEIAQRLYDAGNIIELDVLNQRVLVEEVRRALARTEASALQSRENLALILGLDGAPGAEWSVPARVPTAVPFERTVEDVERGAIAASLDVERERAELVALGHAIGLERLEETFRAGSLGALAEREADGSWLAGPLGSTSLPLWNLGQGAGRTARARFRERYAGLLDTARRVRRAARSLYVAAETTERNARFTRETILPLRANVTQGTQEQFNAMQTGAFELLDARRREISAAREYVELLRTHWRARIRLEALLLGRSVRAGHGLGGATVMLGSGGGSLGSAGSNAPH